MPTKQKPATSQFETNAIHSNNRAVTAVTMPTVRRMPKRAKKKREGQGRGHREQLPAGELHPNQRQVHIEFLVHIHVKKRFGPRLRRQRAERK